MTKAGKRQWKTLITRTAGARYGGKKDIRNLLKEV